MDYNFMSEEIKFHNTHPLDREIYFKIINYKFYLEFIIGVSLLQIVEFTGYNILSVFCVVVSILIYSIELRSLSKRNLEIDLDYSYTNKNLKKLTGLIVFNLVISVLDILLTLIFSLKKIIFLLSLRNFYEKAFCFYSISIILIRTVLLIILYIWNNRLIIVTNFENTFEFTQNIKLVKNDSKIKKDNKETQKDTPQIINDVNSPYIASENNDTKNDFMPTNYGQIISKPTI